MGRPVAVVTGAGRGIGRAVARRLATDGHVVIAASRSAAELAATAAGRDAIVPVVADVGREEDVARLGEAADERGRLAVWVNNAALLERLPFADLDTAAWNRVMSVNLFGVYVGCREAFRRMAAAGGGVIVNMGSLSGVAGVEKFPGLTAYNVSKAGVVGLSEAVALEGRDLGIRCVCISPGAVDTEMLRQAAPHLRASLTPEGMAELVAFVVSPAGAPLSGTNLTLFTNR